MENYDTYKQAISEAEKAQGTAARKMQAYNESIAYSVNQLSVAWEGFAQKLEASPIVKFGYKFLTVVIENLGQILSITLSLMTALRSYKFTTDMKRLADFLGFGKNMDVDSKNKKTGFSVFKMSQKAQEEEQKYTEKKNQNEFERSRSKLIRSNANVREGLDKVAVALDNNTAAQKMQNHSGFKVPSQNGLVPYGTNQEIIPYVPKQEIKVKRNWWRWITGSSVVPGSVYGRKAGKLESNSEKFSSNYQYQNGLFSLSEEDFLKSQKASDMAKKYREQEIIQDAARAEELAKFGAVRKQSIITGTTSGLVAGLITGASTEGDVSDKVRAGLVSGVSTGLLSAIPGIGPIIGPVLGPMLGGILDKYLLKPLLKADEIARKERVEEAKKQLETIKEIGSSVTNIIDLNKTDQSLWDSDDWKKFNEQVETINDALDKSELGEKLKELGLAAGETTIRLKDYSTETLAQAEAERIRFEAEKTYTAGEQDRYTLQKEINENQKKLANLDDDEISKKKELTAAIKAAKAEIEDYSEALKEGYMQASFYSSGVGTMESYDIGNATLDRVIMQIAREWAKDSPDIFAGNQLTSDARSDIISYLREQSGYSSLFKNDTKNVRDMLNAEKAVENLRTTLGMSQKQLKEFANSKDLSEIADKFGATGDALYKIIDQVNLVDEDGISTIAHAMNMTVEQFREANSEGAFDWLTTDVAIGGLDKLNEKLATFNELLLAASENSLFSQENINKIVSQYPTLLKKIDEETGKISVSMDNVQENLVDILAGGESLRKVYAGFFSRDIATSAEKWDVFISSIREDIEKDSALDGFRDEIFKQTNYSGFLKVYEEHKDELESYNQSFIEYAKSLFSTDVFDTQQEILTKYATSTLETEISNLESIRDSLDEVNKQREKEIELIKAKEALENASKEKKRVYRAGVGFVYTTDQEAVKSAQEKVDELERQRDKDDIQYQIDSLQQQKEILENIKDNEQLKALQKTAKETLEALGVKGALVTAILSGSKEEFNAAIKAGLDKDIGEKAEMVTEEENKKAVENAASDLQTAVENFEKIKKRTSSYLQFPEAADEYNQALKNVLQKQTDFREANKNAELNKEWISQNKFNPNDYNYSENALIKNVDKYKDYGETFKNFGDSAYIPQIMFSNVNLAKEDDLQKYMTGGIYTIINPKNGSLKTFEDITNLNDILSKMNEYDVLVNNKGRNGTRAVYRGLDQDGKPKYYFVNSDYGTLGSGVYYDENYKESHKGFLETVREAGENAINWITGLFRGEGFASGTLSAPGGRSLINENGLESIITPSGTITSLPAKSGIIPADLTRNLWALGEVAPNLIARLGGNSLQTNNSNSSTDNSINIQNLDATFNTQSDFDGRRFLTDLRNQVILTANNH